MSFITRDQAISIARSAIFWTAVGGIFGYIIGYSRGTHKYRGIVDSVLDDYLDDSNTTINDSNLDSEDADESFLDNRTELEFPSQEPLNYNQPSADFSEAYPELFDENGEIPLEVSYWNGKPLEQLLDRFPNAEGYVEREKINDWLIAVTPKEYADAYITKPLECILYEDDILVGPNGSPMSSDYDIYKDAAYELKGVYGAPPDTAYFVDKHKDKLVKVTLVKDTWDRYDESGGIERMRKYYE